MLFGLMESPAHTITWPYDNDCLMMALQLAGKPELVGLVRFSCVRFWCVRVRV